MSKHKLDLHDIFNRGEEIDRALREAMDFCTERRIDMLEIIPGKGSGQLKKKVLRFLQQPEVKRRYDRIDKDRDNHGRLFVRFRH
ncbi:MAG TPA: Smr/MutS family protein [Flavobacteriales bacterium]|nr:Smr/MutS family protein [Flavobacteriales bacterium]